MATTWRLAALLAVLPAAFATGCEQNVRPRSLVDQFKILAVKVEPPDVGVMGRNRTIRVSALLADPTGGDGPIEYAVVACTNYDGVVGCLEEAALVEESDIENEHLDLSEEEYREFFTTFVKRGRLETHGRHAEFFQDITLPIELNALMAAYGYTQVDARVYVLACLEGACPVLDDIDAFLAGDPAAPTGEELLYEISIPAALTSGAPMEQSALAKKSYRVLQERTDTSNDNPDIDAWELVDCEQLLDAEPQTTRQCSIEASIDPEKSLQVYEPSPDSSLLTQEVAVVRFYSTAGELVPHTAQFFTNGPMTQASTLKLQPGEDPETIDLYLVLIDSRGGVDYLSLEGVIGKSTVVRTGDSPTVRGETLAPAGSGF